MTVMVGQGLTLLEMQELLARYAIFNRFAAEPFTEEEQTEIINGAATLYQERFTVRPSTFSGNDLFATASTTTQGVFRYESQPDIARDWLRFYWDRDDLFEGIPQDLERLTMPQIRRLLFSDQTQGRPVRYAVEPLDVATAQGEGSTDVYSGSWMIWLFPIPDTDYTPKAETIMPPRTMSGSGDRLPRTYVECVTICRMAAVEAAHRMRRPQSFIEELMAMLPKDVAEVISAERIWRNPRPVGES